VVGDRGECEEGKGEAKAFFCGIKTGAHNRPSVGKSWSKTGSHSLIGARTRRGQVILTNVIETKVAGTRPPPRWSSEGVGGG